MRRTFWVALGAAGGVLAYRRGQQLWVDAREKGVVGSMQAASGSAAAWATSARGLMAALGGTGNEEQPAAPRPTATGAAAARVLAEAKTAKANGPAGPPSTPSLDHNAEGPR